MFHVGIGLTRSLINRSSAYRNDYIEKQYQIVQKYGVFKQIGEANISKEIKSESSKSSKKDEYVNEFEEKRNFLLYLSGVVGTRVVLLQLIPVITILSVFAVDFASSPVLIFCRELSDKLPPLIIKPKDAWNQAEKDLVQQLEKAQYVSKKKKNIMSESIPSWKKYLMAIYIMTTHSRGVQFLIKFAINCVSTALVFFSDQSLIIVIVAVIALAILGLIQAIFAFLLLHKLFFAQEELNKNKNADGISQNSNTMDDSSHHFGVNREGAQSSLNIGDSDRNNGMNDSSHGPDESYDSEDDSDMEEIEIAYENDPNLTASNDPIALPVNHDVEMAVEPEPAPHEVIETIDMPHGPEEPHGWGGFLQIPFQSLFAASSDSNQGDQRYSEIHNLESQPVSDEVDSEDQSATQNAVEMKIMANDAPGQPDPTSIEADNIKAGEDEQQVVVSSNASQTMMQVLGSMWENTKTYADNTRRSMEVASESFIGDINGTASSFNESLAQLSDDKSGLNGLPILQRMFSSTESSEMKGSVEDDEAAEETAGEAQGND